MLIIKKNRSRLCPMEALARRGSKASSPLLGTVHHRLLAGESLEINQICITQRLTVALCQSLATGRLATFSLPFVDCELPYDPDETISNDGTSQPSCEFVGHVFILKVISDSHFHSPVLEGPIWRGVRFSRRSRDINFKSTQILNYLGA